MELNKESASIYFEKTDSIINCYLLVHLKEGGDNALYITSQNRTSAAVPEAVVCGFLREAQIRCPPLYH